MPNPLPVISTFKDEILHFLKECKAEVEELLERGYMEYLRTQVDKYYNSKTFYYRETTFPFDEIYFPISISNDKKSRLKIIDSIEQLFKKSNYISIVGFAGSGKTMLMKKIFLTCTQTYFKIPIVIELRSINYFDGSLIDYIYNLIIKNAIKPSERILERALKSGSFLFLFDGYDEITIDKKEKVTEEIDQFLDIYPTNNYVISSRPGANIESIPRFDKFVVDKLDEQEINDYIDLQTKYEEDRKLAEKIKNEIQKSDNSDYKSFLENPLLLTMFIITFNNYPELPKSKNKFYWNVFDTLCTKHDTVTKKGGFQHERKSKLQNEDIEKILKWFSYVSLFQGIYNFDDHYLKSNINQINEKLGYTCNIENILYDLTTSISILIIDGTEFRFPHRSLQEYFAAKLVSEQEDITKKSIYNGLLQEKSDYYFSGRNTNFWNLCFELDKIKFTNDLIIYNIERFLKNLSNLNEDKKVLKVLKDFNYCITIYSKNDGEFEIGGSSLTVTYIWEILDFLNSNERFSIHKYYRINSNKLDKKYIDIINNYIRNKNIDKKKKDYYLPLYKDEVWNNELISFCKKIGLHTSINEFINKIKELLKQLKIDIKNERKNNLSLINMLK